MEDKIKDEKIIDQYPQRDTIATESTRISQTGDSPTILADEESKQTGKDLYEEQRQYYFGSAATEPTIESIELDPTKPKSYKEEMNLVNLDENEDDIGDQMAFPKSPRQGNGDQKELDSIVELNYEASSDEESLLTKDV